MVKVMASNDRLAQIIRRRPHVIFMQFEDKKTAD